VPAAIPLAVAGGTSLIGGLLGNSQNKSNQQNANNQAQASREYDAQALQTALQNYQQYLKTNPSPASQQAPIQGPTSLYPSSGVINSPTSTANGGPNGQQVNSMVASLLSMAQQPQQGPSAPQQGQVTPLGGNMNGAPATGVPSAVSRRIALPANGAT
jgi:hypothetical protein